MMSLSQTHLVNILLNRNSQNTSHESRAREHAITEQEAQLPQRWRASADITPFKVIDFGSSWKPVCEFLSVNNTNLHPISHRFQVTAIIFITFNKTVPLFNALVLGNLCEYCHIIYYIHSW